MARFIYTHINPVNNMYIFPNNSGLPGKLSHIKNGTILQNSYFPLTGKYVKKVWAYKTTKLGRIKRDLVWEYFRHRKRKPVTQVVRDMFYRNRKKVTFIYFDDPVQHHIELTKEHVDMLKNINRLRKGINCKNPFNNKDVKKLWNKKKIKDTFKKRGVWVLEVNGESTSITEMLIKMYHFNTKDIFFTYTDGTEEELTITDDIFTKLKAFSKPNPTYEIHAD